MIFCTDQKFNFIFELMFKCADIYKIYAKHDAPNIAYTSMNIKINKMQTSHTSILSLT